MLAPVDIKALSRKVIHPAVLLGLLFVASAASAQHSLRSLLDRPPLVQKYLTMQARLMVAFWNPRLNEYRKQIDGMLSASDLVEVNELRARAALLLERMKRRDELLESRRGEYLRTAVDQVASEEQWSDSAAIPDATVDDDPIEDDRFVIDSIDADPEMMARYDEILEIGQREEQRQNDLLQLKRRQLELILAGDEKAIYDSGDETERYPREYYEESDTENSSIAEEMHQLRYAAEWIARNYRPGLEELVARYNADLALFQESLREPTRRLVEIHREELDWSRKSRALAPNERYRALDESLQVLRCILYSLGSRPYIEGIGEGTGTGTPSIVAFYTAPSIEQGLLAYSGQDLRDLASIEDLLGIESSGFESLPPSATIGEIRNNASSNERILPYTVAGPASRVVLQILDGRGTVVATFDQGTRVAGAHTIGIDVDALPAGTYLCQLRIMTEKGDLVYTKAMTVEK